MPNALGPDSLQFITQNVCRPTIDGAVIEYLVWCTIVAKQRRPVCKRCVKAGCADDGVRGS